MRNYKSWVSTSSFHFRKSGIRFSTPKYHIVSIFRKTVQRILRWQTNLFVFLQRINSSPNNARPHTSSHIHIYSIWYHAIYFFCKNSMSTQKQLHLCEKYYLCWLNYFFFFIAQPSMYFVIFGAATAVALFSLVKYKFYYVCIFS